MTTNLTMDERTARRRAQSREARCKAKALTVPCANHATPREPGVPCDVEKDGRTRNICLSRYADALLAEADAKTDARVRALAEKAYANAGERAK